MSSFEVHVQEWGVVIAIRHSPFHRKFLPYSYSARESSRKLSVCSPSRTRCDVYHLAHQRSNLTEALVAAIADGAYAAPDRLPGARASCLTALSLALRRLHVRCAAGDTDDVPSTAVGGDPLDDSDRTVLMVSTVCGGGSAAGSEVLVASSCMSEIAAAAAAAVGSTGLHAPSHCREARRRKHARARGARAFCVKPREGLKLLQEEGVLRPGALDATEVAMFLRTAHGLNKTALGSYLGEAGVKGGTATTASIARGKNLRVNTLEKEGKRQQQQQQQSDSYRNARDEPQEKDYKPIVSAEGPAAETISLAAEKQGSTNAARVSESTGVIVEGGRENSGLEPSAVYRGDTAEFHAEVLDAFVETFDFKGQGLLASLRMFLEAFRLPGEAQQIDRILHVSPPCTYDISGRRLKVECTGSFHNDFSWSARLIISTFDPAISAADPRGVCIIKLTAIPPTAGRMHSRHAPTRAFLYVVIDNNVRRKALLDAFRMSVDVDRRLLCGRTGTAWNPGEACWRRLTWPTCSASAW